MDLNQYIRMSISIGDLLVDRKRIQSPMACESSMPFSRPPLSNSPEPMQLGRARLTPAERHRRLRENLCLYCGECNHNPSTSARVSTSIFLNITKRQFGIPALLSVN